MSSRFEIHVGKSNLDMGNRVIGPVWHEHGRETLVIGTIVGGEVCAQQIPVGRPKPSSKLGIAHSMACKIVGENIGLVQDATGGCIDMMVAFLRLLEGKHVGAYDMGWGLHPSCLPGYVKQVRALLLDKPKAKFTAVAFRPCLLGAVKAEEVHVHAKAPDGEIRVLTLDQHPDYEEWSGNLGTGEFWSTVGEDWVIEASKV